MSLPSSAACPVGRMVFTNIPMIPFGESLPPTMLKPRLFLPAPFSNTIVWNIPLPRAAPNADADDVVVDER